MFRSQKKEHSATPYGIPYLIMQVLQYMHTKNQSCNVSKEPKTNHIYLSALRQQLQTLCWFEVHLHCNKEIITSHLNVYVRLDREYLGPTCLRASSNNVRCLIPFQLRGIADLYECTLILRVECKFFSMAYVHLLEGKVRRLHYLLPQSFWWLNRYRVW
jgi:hypothetical protein